LFGGFFLAAPVLEEGVTTWEVYLPGTIYSADDVWVDFSSKKSR